MANATGRCPGQEAPRFGLLIHLGTVTRCPHSACLARHTPVLTQRHATAGTSIRENSCRAHPRTTSCCHHLRHCGSHAFARTILFQRQRLRLWSYCQLLTSPPRCAHITYVSLPDVAHSVGMKQEDSGGPGKTASDITGFKKSKIEPEVHYLLCHCLARCLPSYCCTGAYWRILGNTGRYCAGASDILRYSKARHTQV